MTVSGGVAQATESDNAQTLVSRADAALYEAKGRGRLESLRLEAGDQGDQGGEQRTAPTAAPVIEARFKRHGC